MRVSCIIATYGDEGWSMKAENEAFPTTEGQGFHDVVVHHDPHCTLAQVRNEAAFLSKGDWLVFLDADDELRPGYLDAMRRVWTEGAITADWSPLLVPAVEYVRDEDGWRQEPRIPQQGMWPQLNECVIGTAVSRACFAEVGGFRELPTLEDYDLWLRCYDAGAQLQYVPEAVYVAHTREGSRNSDQSTYHEIWQDHLDRVGG